MQMNVSRAKAKSKMPSEQVRNQANNAVVTPVEKPFHYTYLKEFRTQQCQDFLQHKCPNHRPFTCFHWHFLNQRRRRPIRKRDGTFNYNPDVYCTKFDDTTGMCPDGDECQYLHRNTGDTERRYHLRYYKTGTCVHETDTRGHCVKNGPHCAFAHGPHDLRQPVYDIREMSTQPKPPTPVPEPTTTNGDSIAPTIHSPISIGNVVSEKDKMVIIDDPQWNDTIFVLANYKTDPCKRPPRLCRQGYACPQYHNTRDRRRSPMIFRYRSTPCPNVKHGDDWGEISSCEQEDMCQYCHTRTEQQFHPEIYKSTKCNDMQQTGYCPRGPFCAFAHVEQEMSSQRDFTQELGNLAVSSAAARTVTMPPNSSVTTLGQHIGLLPGNDNPQFQPTTIYNPGVIAKPRSNSASSSYSSEGSHLSSTFPKAVAPVTSSEDATNSVFSHGSTLGHIGLANNPGQPQGAAYGVPNSGMSATAMPFYPTHDTVESVIGNALDDLNLEDFDVSALDRELDDNNSVGSSGASVTHVNPGLHIPSTSAPVNIPGGGQSTIGGGSGINHKSMSGSPASPLSQLPPPFVPQHIQQQQQQQQQIEQAAAAFMSRPNTTPHSSLHLGSILDPPRPPGSPSSTGAGRNQHNMMSPGRSHNPGPDGDHQRLQEEVNTLRNKLQTWEESWNQAKQACDAWKQEASEWGKKAESLSQEKQALLQSKDEALQECKALKQEVDGLTEGSHLHILNKVSELSSLPLSKLKQMQTQLRTDIEKLDKVIHVREFLLCRVCKNYERSVSILPCHHVVFCPSCAPSQTECPSCHQKVTSHTNASIPF